MLCDVPCTGDGTVRKNVDARTKWTVCNAYTLHKEQLSIMRHCLQHVKVGGQFVYSTCTVVASLLREFGSSIELVDARPMLKGLKYMEGLKQWTVFDKQMNVVTQKTDNIPQTAFPPSTDEVDKYHLEYTLRILPHHQNTGGFYSAVFIKKAETAKVEDPIKNKGKQEEGHDNSKKTTKRKRGQAPIDEQIMQSLLQTSGGKETFDKLKTFYHLSDSFPSEQLYVMGDDCNIIHFLSKKAVNVASVIKVISGGVRMFRKHKSALSDTQRIVSEGCAAVGPYVGDNRRVVVSEAMFKKLLNGLVTVVDVINESKQYTNNATNNTDDIGNACFIMKIADGILKDNLYCAWLGKTYVSLLINKQDLHAFRFLFDIVVVETTRTLDNDPNQQEGLNDAPEKKLKDNNN
ncbi:SAM-dependent MTase RsmB/NOP-type domain-containing protein [Entamoeba marina]